MSTHDTMPSDPTVPGSETSGPVRGPTGTVTRQPATQTTTDALDVDDVMRRVHAEITRRQAVAGRELQGAPVTGGPELLPDQDSYALGDFLRFNDADFMDVVYRKLLRRPANDAGSRDYLRALRTGRIGKVDVLGLVRWSDEGCRYGVPVAGLRWRYRLRRLRRVRGIGWCVGMGMAIAHLPRLAQRLQGIEATAAQHFNGVYAGLRQSDVAREAALACVEGHIDLLRASLGEQQHVVGEQLRVVDEQLRSYTTELVRLDDRAQDDRRRLRAMLERLTVFLDVAVRQQQGGGGVPTHADQALEKQYASLEDVFRGERSEIKLRVSHYLGTLTAAGVVPEDRGIILDLGSGRGEWLEVLAEHGYRGRGVDTNRGMLERSVARGHDVVEANAIDYLRAQEDGSLAAVTAMHLVEHIPHSALLELLDQALRVLRPGGVLILETPNPENVRVGSYTFYMDPTHRNPIPPLLLQWVVQARGFENSVIDRLSDHRGEPAMGPVADTTPGAQQINLMVNWFTTAPDYAVTARKAGAVPLR